jgi:hypothetical protein
LADQDASDPAPGSVSIHPVENFFGMVRRIIRNVNMFNQTLTLTVNLRLMNEGIEIVSKEGDSDVRRIPARTKRASVRIREAQMDQEDCSWLTIRIEDPKAVAVAFLRAYRHSDDINQPNGSKFKDFLDI